MDVMSGGAALLPVDEALRLEAVRRYEILDTPADGTFDRITRLAARIFDVPIAIVSIVDADRIWFKSHHGLPDVHETGRDPGLCASAILQNEPWVVTDAGRDPRTLANPLVASGLGLRFYVGIPLTTPDGFNLGTLCVIDQQPRTVTTDEVDSLQDLAALVVDELELRLRSRRVVDAEARLRKEAEQLADTLQASLLPPKPPTVPGMDIAARFHAGEVGLQIGGDFYDVFRLGTNDWGIVLGDACGRGAAPASLAATARWCMRAAAGHDLTPSAVLRSVNATLLEETGADDQFCTALFARLELDTCGAWVTVANAGHPLPVMVRASEELARRGTSTLPLGLFPDLEATDERIGLGPGDFLVMYTDGITEARSPDGAFFGEDGLTSVLQSCAGAASAADVADALMGAAAAWSSGAFSDDSAVLVVRVPGDAGADPVSRLEEATGVPVDELALPGYPHESDGHGAP
jgi:sigma-B regulation protein RsbU (phosphoserine phosphatase)